MCEVSMFCVFFWKELSLVVLVLYCTNQLFHYCSLLGECLNCVHFWLQRLVPGLGPDDFCNWLSMA